MPPVYAAWTMIDLYFAPTANGHKITIMLEEVELPYRIMPIDITRGEQFAESFAAINPNAKIPAIVDHDPPGGGPPLTVFESGAVLLYLAEKTGRLLPTDLRGRIECVQWVFWQVANLGPIAGQAHHFLAFAPEKVPYAIKRFSDETFRLCGVLNKRLAERQYLAGEYSIADIACWTWSEAIAGFVPDFAAKFPHAGRWLEAVRNRPAVRKGQNVGQTVTT
jgi:GSH-dependent disulfide-bond oxidoreductase